MASSKGEGARASSRANASKLLPSGTAGTQGIQNHWIWDVHVHARACIEVDSVKDAPFAACFPGNRCRLIVLGWRLATAARSSCTLASKTTPALQGAGCSGTPKCHGISTVTS